MTPNEINAQWVNRGRRRQGLDPVEPAPTRTRARRLWTNTCIGWGCVWLLLGLFLWPALLLSVASFFMIAIPVGVRD